MSGGGNPQQEIGEDMGVMKYLPMVVEKAEGCRADPERAPCDELTLPGDESSPPCYAKWQNNTSQELNWTPSSHALSFIIPDDESK